MEMNKIIEYFKNLIFRCLLVTIIFLLIAIFSKKSSNFKNYIVSNVYEKNFSFVKAKKFYNKYLGGIVPLERFSNNVSPVFNESLQYDSESKYYDGVKLKVSDSYLVPVLEEGMVTYIGEKEKYGNVVIITTIEDKNIWYGNMNRVAVKLYDYVSKGDYLGEVKDNNLYLVISQNNIFLDYEEYLNEN